MIIIIINSGMGWLDDLSVNRIQQTDLVDKWTIDEYVRICIQL